MDLSGLSFLYKIKSKKDKMISEVGKTIMVCGCTANGYLIKDDKTSTPCCVVHSCDEVANEVPDLDGRVAICQSCKREKESNAGLAFFSHRPNAEKDVFYCGCRGWD